jgi:hypothetical protein
MSHEQLLAEIRQLTPEEATAVMNEFTAGFHAPPPAPLVPANAREASARLSELTSDANWVHNLLNKDYATVEEFHKLSALAADATVFDPVADQMGDTSVGPGLDGPKLSRREAIGVASDLRAQGASDAEIELILSDQPYPSDVVRDAHYWLPRMQGDPFLRVPLPGYQEADRENLMRFFQRAIAIGDGSGPF